MKGKICTLHPASMQSIYIWLVTYLLTHSWLVTYLLTHSLLVGVLIPCNINKTEVKPSRRFDWLESKAPEDR